MNILTDKDFVMRITVKQLKRLIRETVQDIDPMDLERQAHYSTGMEKQDLFDLYSDMYKEMYNIRPRWLKLEEVSEDQLRALIEHLEERYEEEIKSRQREAQDQERFFNELEKEREKEDKAKKQLADLGYEDLENLPRRSGMGKRLRESIKKAVREALKGDQDELDVAPPFGKLTGDDFKKLGKKSKKKSEEKEEDE